MRGLTQFGLARLLPFPFLFGGTFIEGLNVELYLDSYTLFPFLFGGTFIEGDWWGLTQMLLCNFPSFSEGLSLRAVSIAGD